MRGPPAETVINGGMPALSIRAAALLVIGLDGKVSASIVKRRATWREYDPGDRLAKMADQPDPFATFTPAALRVLDRARSAARGFDRPSVGPEDVLIGLAQEPEGLAAKALARLNVDMVAVRDAVAYITGRTWSEPTLDPLADELRLGPAVTRICAAATTEATKLGHDYVGTEHLLLALIAEAVGVSAGILDYLGIGADAVRDAVKAAIADAAGLAKPDESVGVAPTAVTAGEEAAAPTVEPSPVAGITFADVEGCDEAKVELRETIDFLLHPERFARFGAKIPRGVLFYGPPGTGKTLLAKAVAGEAGVPFYPVSGSGFVEMYVGVGAKRVRELFKKARHAGRGIIFIDEIDSLAGKRSAGGSGGDREADQTLNALLVEMDGFGTTDGLIVIAATNRLDMLDPAVLRAGRFTRKIELPLPDRVARRAILGVHAKGKPLAKGVDLDRLAADTGGMSGAELANLLNEAAILAARRDGDSISVADVHAGWLKSILGTSLHSSMDPPQRAIIAAHEAGHAICGRMVGNETEVSEISMYRHGNSLGVTVSTHTAEYGLPRKSELRRSLVGLMGGRAAEQLLWSLEEVTVGASNDLEKANDLVADMVNAYAMGPLGAPSVDAVASGAFSGPSGRGQLGFLVGDNIKGDLAQLGVEAMRALLDEAFETATEILIANRPILDKVSGALFDVERLNGKEFAAICEGTRRVAPKAINAWRLAQPQLEQPKARKPKRVAAASD
jgi:cell division protease FtsH